MLKIKVSKRRLPPPAKAGPRAPYVLVILALKPGESFKAPLERRRTLAVQCSRYGRRTGRTFATRKEGDSVLVFRVG